MVRITGIKWDKVTQCVPAHNIASSDFLKYYPQPWKFMVNHEMEHLDDWSNSMRDKELTPPSMLSLNEGKPRIEWLLSYEYQRMWMRERELWQKRMYTDITATNVDIIKRYVMSFRNNNQPANQDKKELFKMKKFQCIGSKISTKRPPGDKAMNFKKNKTPVNKK